MIKIGLVYFNDDFAGRLEYREGEYIFTYDQAYLHNTSLPPIALSFPKTGRVYRSPVLFPFFYGILAEGDNKKLQCTMLKIDEQDHFSRLLKTAGADTIGAVTIREAAV
jgi:serine/threonine-protein kinase HipA